MDHPEVHAHCMQGGFSVQIGSTDQINTWRNKNASATNLQPSPNTTGHLSDIVPTPEGSEGPWWVQVVHISITQVPTPEGSEGPRWIQVVHISITQVPTPEGSEGPWWVQVVHISITQVPTPEGSEGPWWVQVVHISITQVPTPEGSEGPWWIQVVHISSQSPKCLPLRDQRAMVGPSSSHLNHPSAYP